MERIAQEKARGESTLATLNKERESLLQRQVEIQNQLNHDRKDLEQIGIELSKTVINAPIDGTIFQLNLRNPGQVVRPSDLIAQIAPSNATLMVKALVQTQDRNKVKIGQDVHMRVDSCPYPNFGTLKGTVKAISADAIAPQVTGTDRNAPVAMTTQSSSISVQKGAYFEVTIQPKSLSLAQGEQQCAIRSGMEGRADIISREETVLQFVLRKARLLTDL
jgi:multidrug efflux pump subunit AcrA (membrane-fusion protein)